ncbi:hypothetical protein TI04_09275, partial [Achromatium sp. WMS2]
MLLVSTPVTAKFRALLIGIDYNGANPYLNVLSGAQQDVAALHGYLTQDLGVPATSIHTLQNAQATRAGIIAEIEHWLLASKQGDTVLFFYSGHGLTVPDPFANQTADPVKRPGQTTTNMWLNSTPSTELAEAFVPYDTQIDIDHQAVQGLILDTEFQTLLTQFQGRNVILWLDMCHSSGVTKGIASPSIRNKSVRLPWAVTATKVLTNPALIKSIDIADDTSQTLHSSKYSQHPSGWNPPYILFAATQHYLSAYDKSSGGFFTQTMLQLLRANVQANYTNRQVLNYVRKHLGVPLEQQDPLFYGPTGALDQPFPLLALRHYSEHADVPTELAKPTPLIYQPLRIDMRNHDHLCSRIASTIAQSPDMQLDANNPDLLINCNNHNVILYDPTGYTLYSLPLQLKPVLAELLHQVLHKQLEKLHNPVAPFQVQMWIDEPGKTKFNQNAKITLYYQANNLPVATAYLTLFNLSPDGSLSVIYPQLAYN